MKPQTTKEILTRYKDKEYNPVYMNKMWIPESLNSARIKYFERESIKAMDGNCTFAVFSQVLVFHKQVMSGVFDEIIMKEMK